MHFRKLKMCYDKQGVELYVLTLTNQIKTMVQHIIYDISSFWPTDVLIKQTADSSVREPLIHST